VDQPGGGANYQQVLAAVDPMAEESDDCASLVMDLASSLADRESAQFNVVHAWKMSGESMLRDGRSRLSRSEFNMMINLTEKSHRQHLQALLNDYGMSVDDSSVHLVHGDASKVIHHVADNIHADLIVMGTVGRSGVPGLFIGNTAEDLLQNTNTSILAVKPAGFVSPVK
jgi:nucleotide-binding universal stress UspA family protein